MRFPERLVRGTLLRRYKRFLADVRLRNGRQVTAHCPNPGSMLGVGVPLRPVALSRSDDPSRKLAYTFEMIELERGWVGVHTGRTNDIVAEALLAGRIPELAGFVELRREVACGDSRLDFRSTMPDGGHVFVEVKNVTLTDGADRALFPDSVTTRGQKHLRELIGLVDAGYRAAMLFLVNRGDCQEFGPADAIDPDYGALLREAATAGVQILAYRAAVDPQHVTVERSIPTVL